VLIPCFNEEKVIEASVRRILASNWRDLEVLVLDDGSADATAEVVRKAFADEPRVTLMSFENGGKARALNRGLRKAQRRRRRGAGRRHPVPADTLAARPLVRRPAGRRGGRQRHRRQPPQPDHPLAGAGICHAQNLERRALAALGAVTVVPGAVGAWRRRR
jgi:hypothetical protein